MTLAPPDQARPDAERAASQRPPERKEISGTVH
jgi:hypothetical protein